MDFTWLKVPFCSWSTPRRWELQGGLPASPEDIGPGLRHLRHLRGGARRALGQRQGVVYGWGRGADAWHDLDMCSVCSVFRGMVMSVMCIWFCILWYIYICITILIIIIIVNYYYCCYYYHYYYYFFYYYLLLLSLLFLLLLYIYVYIYIRWYVVNML